MLWALVTPSRLPRRVRDDIQDADNDVFASAASTWEIAIKSALGKIDADVREIAAACAVTGILELPVSFTHTARVASLPPHHRDPFDRMLIAQALEEGLTLVSRDQVFDLYGAPTRWD